MMGMINDNAAIPNIGLKENYAISIKRKMHVMHAIS